MQCGCHLLNSMESCSPLLKAPSARCKELTGPRTPASSPRARFCPASLASGKLSMSSIFAMAAAGFFCRRATSAAARVACLGLKLRPGLAVTLLLDCVSSKGKPSAGLYGRERSVLRPPMIEKGTFCPLSSSYALPAHHVTFHCANLKSSDCR